jgi:hypothetical protein
MYQHIAAELSRAETGRTALARLGDEVSAFLTPLVSVAKSRGEVSETISAHDFAIYMQMAASVLHVGMSDEEIDTNLDVAMRILTLGTQPR